MLASSTSAAAASSASSSYGASNKVAPEDTSAQDVGPKRVKQPDTLKQKIYYTFDDPSYSTAAKVISLGMMVVIVITTFSVRRHRHRGRCARNDTTVCDLRERSVALAE